MRDKLNRLNLIVADIATDIESERLNLEVWQGRGMKLAFSDAKKMLERLRIVVNEAVKEHREAVRGNKL